MATIGKVTPTLLARRPAKLTPESMQQTLHLQDSEVGFRDMKTEHVTQQFLQSHSCQKSAAKAAGVSSHVVANALSFQADSDFNCGAVIEAFVSPRDVTMRTFDSYSNEEKTVPLIYDVTVFQHAVVKRRPVELITPLETMPMVRHRFGDDEVLLPPLVVEEEFSDDDVPPLRQVPVVDDSDLAFYNYMLERSAERSIFDGCCDFLYALVLLLAINGLRVVICHIIPFTTVCDDVVYDVEHFQGAKMCRTKVNFDVKTPIVRLRVETKVSEVETEQPVEEVHVQQGRKGLKGLEDSIKKSTLNPSEMLALEKHLKAIREADVKKREAAIRNARDKKHRVLDVDQPQSFSSMISVFQDSFLKGDFDVAIYLYNIIYSRDLVQMSFNVGLFIREVGCPLSATQIIDLISSFFSGNFTEEVEEVQAKRARRGANPFDEEIDPEEQDLITTFFARYFHIHSKKQGFIVLALMMAAIMFKETEFSNQIQDLRDFASGRDFAVGRLLEHVMYYLAGKFSRAFGYTVCNTEKDIGDLLRKDAMYTTTTNDGVAYKYQYYPAYKIELLHALEKLVTLEKSTSRGDVFTLERLRKLKVELTVKIADAEDQSNNRRVEPFVIAIVGGPSVGKTTITKAIADISTRALGLGTLDEYVTHLSETADGKFVVAKRGIVDMWDDLGMRDVTNAYFQIMEFANDVPMILASAALEDKGKNKVDSILGIITSNYTDLGVRACKNINNKAAFMRRIDMHVEIVVKPEYRQPGLFNTVSSMLNSRQFLEDSIKDEQGYVVQPDAWLFRVSKIFVDGDRFELQLFKEFHTTYDFFAYYKETFLATREHRTKALKARTETLWCGRCGLPRNVHTSKYNCEPLPVEKTQVIEYVSTAQRVQEILAGTFNRNFREIFQPESTEKVDEPVVETVDKMQTYKRSFFGREVEVNTFGEIVRNFFFKLTVLMIYYFFCFIASYVYHFLFVFDTRIRINLRYFALWYQQVWYNGLLHKIHKLLPDPATCNLFDSMVGRVKDFGLRVAYMENFYREYKRWSQGLKAIFWIVMASVLVKGAHALYKRLFPVQETVYPQMYRGDKDEHEIYPSFRSYSSPKRKFVDLVASSVYQYAIFESLDELNAWYAGEQIVHGVGSGYFISGKIFITVKHCELLGKWMHFFPRDGINDKVVSDFRVAASQCYLGERDYQYVYVSGTVARPDLLLEAERLAALEEREHADLFFSADEIRIEDHPYRITMRQPCLLGKNSSTINYTLDKPTLDGHSGSVYLHARGGKYYFAHHEGLASTGCSVAKFLDLDEFEESVDYFDSHNFPVSAHISSDLSATLGKNVIVEPDVGNELGNYSDICGILVGKAQDVITTGKPRQAMFPTVLEPELKQLLPKELASPSGVSQMIPDPDTGELRRISPFAQRLNTIGARNAIDVSVLDHATTEYIARLDMLIPVEERVRFPPLDMDTICNGNKELKVRGINWDSSAGFGLRGTKKNYRVSVNGRHSFTPDIQAQIDAADASYLKGEYNVAITKAAIKMDEMISKEKVEAAKSRQVYVMDLIFLVLSKKYFGPILAVMAKYPFAFECMVGINAASKDWEKLRDYLMSRDYEACSSDDYSTYDGKIDGIPMECGHRVFRWAAKNLCKYTPEEMLALDCLLNMSMQPMYVYRNHFKLMTTSEFSGHCATAQLNSILNSIYQRASWRYCVMKVFDLKCYPPDYFNFDWWNLSVTYGDDLLNARDKTMIEKISGKLIQEGFAAFGQTVTSAHDKKLPPSHEDFSKMSFLKRTWREVTWFDYTFWSAPLDKSTIWKMLCYNGVSKHVSSGEILQQVAENAYREMWMHGPEEFEAYCDFIEPIFVKHNVVTRVGRHSAREWTEKMRKQEFVTWTSGDGLVSL